MPSYSDNALAIYKRLYFVHNPELNIVETKPSQVHKRVAKYISNNNNQYDEFKYMLDEQIFRPNTPCLLNAGLVHSNNHDANLCACFVIGLEDSMESITDMFKTVSLIYSSGAGAGMEMSRLREKNAPLSGSGFASGPISFMTVIQKLSEVVKSGGRNRRAANLISFLYNHPDIMDFIVCKNNNDLSAMNISILVNSEFFDAVDNDDDITLKSPTGQQTSHIKAKTIWNAIIDNAWATGDPGLLFQDNTNKFNKCPSIGEISATNPCLPEWTFVKTADGYKYFGDINNEIGINGQTQHCSPLIKTHSSANIVQVSLESGLNLYATENHVIKLKTGQKEIRQLKTYDKVVVDYIPFNNIVINNHELNYGFITGLLLNASHFYKVDQDGEIIIDPFNVGRDFTYLIEETINSYLNSDYRFNNYILYINNSKDTKKLLKIYGTFQKESIELINNRSISFQLGVIKAILLNSGLYNGDSIVIEDNKEFKEIYYQIQLILNWFGVYSQLVDDLTQIKLYIWEIDTLSRLFDISSNDQIANVKIAVPEKIKNLKKYQKIKSISFHSNDTVYDINVPNGNYFVADGVVVHNCGEVPLIDWSTCNLGSINLNKFLLPTNEIDYPGLSSAVQKGVEFLDNVIDKTSYINDKFKANMLKYRPVGLGIMGFSDILYKKKIAYDSNEAISLLENISRFITKTAYEYSIDLIYSNIKEPCKIPESDHKHFTKLLNHYGVDEEHIDRFISYGIRNTEVTCYAPTGSISISADASYSFEPIFALVWEKTLVDSNEVLKFIHPEFKKYIPDICNECQIDENTLLNDIINHKGSIQHIEYVPNKYKSIFKVAHDISPEFRIKIQGAAQKYVSMAISSTINLPNSATKEDVEYIYRLAHKEGLKGITIYRDGCLDFQPVEFGSKDTTQQIPSPVNNEKHINVDQRPIVRTGKTIEVKTPQGKLFLTGNYINNELGEVFIRLSKQGTLVSVLVDALARAISKGLQHGVNPQCYIDTLIDIQGENFWCDIEGNSQSKMMASIPDAIAKILDTHFIESSSYNITTINDDIINGSDLKLCPSCGKMGIKPGYGGCRSGSCIYCAYSACSG